MRRRRRRLSAAVWRRLFLGALILGHLAWVLSPLRGPALLPRLVAGASRPGLALSARWEAWRAARAQRRRDLEAAQAEIRALRAQLDWMRLEAQTQAPRLAEMDETQRLLGLRKALPLDLRGARVVANLRRAPFGGMILDQGWDAGLVQDQGVICPEGVVGRVWQVAASHASLLPLDAYNASTAVMLARGRATGVLQGVGPGRAEIRYVGSQEVVQPGEPVLTSGLDRVYPRGLLVGWVSRVQHMEVELRLEVVLAAPLDRVHQVLLLPPKPDLELKPPDPPPARKGVEP